ncbi:reverse transcriptase [Caerostris extrusa]|uniref:Reverse transcriptase n=1 Tax=Caerostris extrusa TaxID=172846 RepID=A0AAV4SDM9_CAEEX|nr:reverse transcriptase [Caerostris extrusa]
MPRELNPSYPVLKHCNHICYLRELGLEFLEKDIGISQKLLSNNLIFIANPPDIKSPCISSLSTPCSKNEKCFQPKGESTPFIEHRINTGYHLPVVVSPYRMFPANKEILKKEIDRLLGEGIIEEYESPYAFSVVLITKSNGDQETFYRLPEVKFDKRSGLLSTTASGRSSV